MESEERQEPSKMLPVFLTAAWMARSFSPGLGPRLPQFPVHTQLPLHHYIYPVPLANATISSLAVAKGSYCCGRLKRDWAGLRVPNWLLSSWSSSMKESDVIITSGTSSSKV